MRNKRRPHQILMEELAPDSSLWDLETHIKGCFAGHQLEPEFGTAVYFALEMLSGIAVQGRHLENEGLTEDLSAPDATLRRAVAIRGPLGQFRSDNRRSGSGSP